MIKRYSGLWWASILLSSVVTGGGSFLLLSLLTELPVEIVIAASVALILAGDVTLALLMEAVSPTRVTLGPGDRRHSDESPGELGTVTAGFIDRSGKVSIRGEQWRARQSPGCDRRLDAGTPVRVLEREGLTLVVAAVD
jgi:membrane protein implicated in regulation of membrane protease activity